MSALTLKYRPHTFHDTTGQKPVRAVLRQMVIQQEMPPALLLTGPRGTGKTTTARILAAALNCPQRGTAQADPCGVCASCQAVQMGNSPAVLEIDAASNGLVGDIRSLRETVLYSVGGTWRVVLLDEAHSMSREAFNALLKTLEEPPPQTVFVLLTTEPNRIIETVLSRCMTLEFRKLTPQDIIDRLSHIASLESIPHTPELLELIAERANGGMRDAVMQLDQARRVGITTPDQLKTLLGEKDTAPVVFENLVSGALHYALTGIEEDLARTGDPAAVATQLSAFVRDLFVLQGGGKISAQGQALNDRQRLAQVIEPAQLFAAARVLWDFKTKIRMTDDPRSALDLAVVMLQEALLGQSAPSARAQAPTPPKTLTLAEMQAIALGKS